MRKLWVVLSVVGVLVAGASSAFSASIENGEKIVKSFLAKKDAVINVTGDLTTDPILEFIYTNDKAFGKLKEDDIESICLFMRNKVKEAKRDPAPYIRIPKNAPIYMKAYTNAKNMCDDCWGISSKESTIILGDEAWDRSDSSKHAVSFSKLTHGRYGDWDGQDTRGTSVPDEKYILDKRMQIFTKKVSSETFYTEVLSRVTASIDELTFNVNNNWHAKTIQQKENIIKNAFSLWLNIGKMLGKNNEDASSYSITILDNNNIKTGSWDALRGFRVIK